MKTKNKILLSCITLSLIIFSITFVTADETDVVITGMKGYVFNVTVNMYRADGEWLATQENNTDAVTGIARFRFTSSSQKVSFYVVARSNGKILPSATKKPVDIGNYSSGAYVYIDLFPTTKTTTTPTPVDTQDSSDSIPTNNSDSSDNTENSTIIDLGNSFSTKASEIYGTTKDGLKKAYPWILWGLLGLGVLTGVIFGGWKIIKWNKNRYISRTKRYEDLVSSEDNERPIVQKQSFVRNVNENSTNRHNSFETDLEKAEEKIKEAQEEIARIKSRKNRLNEAEKRYEYAKEELEKLKDEE